MIDVNALVGELFEVLRSVKEIPNKERTIDDKKLHALATKMLLHIFDMFGGVNQ